MAKLIGIAIVTYAIGMVGLVAIGVGAMALGIF